MVLKHHHSLTVLACRVVATDHVRFLQPRSDGQEFYVVGQVDRVYSAMHNARVLVIDGDSWTVPSTWEVELI